MQQILDSHELNSHAHFWPCPPKNHWNNFELSWICTSMQKPSSVNRFILRYSQFYSLANRMATTIFDHAHANIFWSTFNSCEFVWTRKKSGYFTDLFWRYGWLKNLAIWLPENILARLSGTKLFPNMGFALEYYQYYKFSLSKILGWSTLSSTFKNSTRWKSYKDGFFWLYEIWLFWFNDFILFLCLFRIFKLRILVARPK